LPVCVLIRVVNEDRSVIYAKALHEAIVNEADFWLVQEMMGKNKPSKIKSNKDFPLRGLLRCHCGKYMTAGWSKGKNKYYCIIVVSNTQRLIYQVKCCTRNLRSYWK
jgi:hypothetical protein